MKARNMRKQCTNIAILLSLSAGAQDWALFPLGIPQYYADSAAAPVTVDQYLLDSVREEGVAQIRLFNMRAWKQVVGDCSISLSNANGYLDPWGTTHHWPKDSLIVRGDTVFKYSEYGSLPFYFLPHAAVGQAWTVISDFPWNGYDQITVTCTGLEQRSFLGITDSVKLFSLLPNGSLPGQVPISDFQIVLSKHHGLVEFVPFDLFLHHPMEVDFTALELIGLDDPIDPVGFEKPDFADFFHLLPGDVMIWEYEDHPANISLPTTHFYARDSLTASTLTADSASYSVHRRKIPADGGPIVEFSVDFQGDRTIYQALLNSGPRAITVQNTPVGGIPYFPGGDGSSFLWTAPYGSYQAPLTMDTVTSWGYYMLPYEFGAADCSIGEVSDWAYTTELNTREGFTKVDWSLSTSNIRRWTLIGSIIDGVASGDFTVGMASTPAMATGAAVWPNPALDHIQVDLPDSGSPWSYALYDAMGREWGRGLLLADGVDVAQLPAGAYVLQAQAEGRVVNLRFVKQWIFGGTGN
jgi:hypothetical protein